MDYFRGYRLLRKDPEWVSKLLLLSLFLLSTSFIPLLGQILMQGWLALLFRQVVREEEFPLPPLKFDLDYLGKLLGVGIKPMIVAFVWQIPVMLLAFFVVGTMYAIQIAVLVSGAEDEVVLVSALCFLGAVLMLIPLVAAVSVPMAVATVRAELADDFGSGFQFGEIISFSRAHLWTILKAFLIYALVGLFLGPLVAVFTCYLGLFPFAVIMTVCSQVFIADLYRQALRDGMTPWPTRPNALDAAALPAATGFAG